MFKRFASSATQPQTFLQRVVQSDGSSFIIRTTSPRPLLTLTKDTRNHRLWNPELVKSVDQSIHLDKFTQKFGNLSFSSSTAAVDLGFEAFAAPTAAPVKKDSPTAASPKKK